jgi:hypothetical protein
MTELMILGSDKGIAGMENFKGIDDVLSFTPWFRQHNWCEGTNCEALTVIVVDSDGNHTKLSSDELTTYGDNHIPERRIHAEPVGVQLANKSSLTVALLFEYKQQDQNEGIEWDEYLLISEPDWAKVRTRIEDALRETSDRRDLFRLAQELGCTIF